MEEKYKCTYYKCRRDGGIKVLKTVISTSIVSPNNNNKPQKDDAGESPRGVNIPALHKNSPNTGPSPTKPTPRKKVPDKRHQVEYIAANRFTTHQNAGAEQDLGASRNSAETPEHDLGQGQRGSLKSAQPTLNVQNVSKNPPDDHQRANRKPRGTGLPRPKEPRTSLQSEDRNTAPRENLSTTTTNKDRGTKEHLGGSTTEELKLKFEKEVRSLSNHQDSTKIPESRKVSEPRSGKQLPTIKINTPPTAKEKTKELSERRKSTDAPGTAKVLQNTDNKSTKEDFSAKRNEDSSGKANEDSPAKAKEGFSARRNEVTSAKKREVLPATANEDTSAKKREVAPAKEDTSTKKNEVTPATAKEDTSAKKHEVTPAKEDTSTKKREDTPAKEDTSAKKREDTPAKEDTSAKKNEVTPAKAKDDTPVKAKDDTPVKAKDDTPAKAKEDTSAKKREVTPAKAKDDTPAKARADIPANAKKDNPAKPKELISTKTKEEKEDTPAKAKDDTPVKKNEVTPATVKEDTPAKTKKDNPAKTMIDNPAKPKELISTMAKEENQIKSTDTSGTAKSKQNADPKPTKAATSSNAKDEAGLQSTAKATISSRPLPERKPPQVNIQANTKPYPPTFPTKTTNVPSGKIEAEFMRLKTNHIPLVSLFGLTHPSISQHKLNLLEKISKNFDFALVNIDKVIGDWKNRSKSIPLSIPELARELGHSLLHKTSDYTTDKTLTEAELCRIMKYAIVAFHKTGKSEHAGFILENFPVSPKEASLLEEIIYPIAVGIYMFPTTEDNAVTLPVNFRRSSIYDEKLCRKVAYLHDTRLLEILHPAALNDTKITLHLIPVIQEMLDNYWNTVKQNGLQPVVLGRDLAIISPTESLASATEMPMKSVKET